MTAGNDALSQDTLRQSRISWRLIAIVVFVSNSAILMFALAVASPLGVEPRIFYQDPASVAHLGFYTGWFSSLGASLWIGSGAAALFAGTTTCRWDGTFLGILTLTLGLDDLLLLHEGVLRAAHISEVVAMIVYAVAGLLWFFRLRNKAFDGAMMFVAAGFLLALAALIDKVGWLAPLPAATVTVVEEVVKEFGIFLWAPAVVGYAAMVARLGRQTDFSPPPSDSEAGAVR